MSKAEGLLNIWLKPKVLVGFLVIVAFAVAAVSITYNGFIELSRAKQSLSQPNKKLLLLNSALADIYEAESNIRAYNLTQKEAYLNTYFKFLIKISEKVDTLLTLTNYSESQSLKIKTIKQLLERKESVLEAFVELKKMDRSSIFYERALEEIAKVQTATSSRAPIITRSITTTTTKRDTVLERSPSHKSGFFGRIRKWLSGKEKIDTTLTKTRVETQIDTIVRAGFIPDSLVEKVVVLLNQIRSEQQKAWDLASIKELELLKSDKELMDQIRVIVSLLEQEELSLSYKRSISAEEVVRKSTTIVLTLGGAALIMMLLFLALIFRDISKSNYYRNELFEAKRYAEKLLKVKEQFLANMSHEIRTPLSSIIGLTRQLKRTELNSKQNEQVKLIISSSEHLLNVINDILDFSKIEGGHMRIESLPFNPIDVIQESINTIQHKADEKNLYIERVEQNAITTTTWGDPFRLKQIILNLLSNAIKFTDKGGKISIIIGSEEIKNDFIKITITVKDTGIGISTEQQALIFEEFSQADPSITRKYGGTGLGLTIVKRLTELQGGELSIESKQNEGTSISISIPYKLTGEQIEKRTEQTNHLSIFGKFNVLVIDDDDVNRLITEELLKSLNISVITTSNPFEALDLIKANNFNLILTDIQMPGLSGYDIVDLVTKAGYTIPVVAITANSMIDGAIHFTESGFAGYLIKPFSEIELIKIIEPFALFHEESKSHTEHKSNADSGYDLSDIYRFAGDDMQSVRLILSTFLVNTDNNLQELNQVVENRNLKESSAVAHKMKSAFKQFKIYNIAELLQKIEQIEDKGNYNEVKALVEEVNIQIKPILKLLKKELEQIGN